MLSFQGVKHNSLFGPHILPRFVSNMAGTLAAPSCVQCFFFRTCRRSVWNLRSWILSVMLGCLLLVKHKKNLNIHEMLTGFSYSFLTRLYCTCCVALQPPARSIPRWVFDQLANHSTKKFKGSECYKKMVPYFVGIFQSLGKLFLALQLPGLLFKAVSAYYVWWLRYDIQVLPCLKV